MQSFVYVISKLLFHAICRNENYKVKQVKGCNTLKGVNAYKS